MDAREWANRMGGAVDQLRLQISGIRELDDQPAVKEHCLHHMQAVSRQLACCSLTRFTGGTRAAQTLQHPDGDQFVALVALQRPGF